MGKGNWSSSLFLFCFVFLFTIADNRWQQISPLTPYKKMIPSSRRHHSAVAYENKMFVFGGLIDLRGSSSELWSFNFVDHEWDLISPTPKNYPGSRYGHSAVVYNRAMWILGGLGNHQAKNDLWKWSFGNNSWSKVKTRGGPLPIHGHRVAKCGNAMLIFGGSINGEYRNTIWKFEFEALSWSLITPHGGVSPPARSAPAVVTLSAFSLPLLPPQLVTPKQNSRGDVHQSDIVEELRPHSSPEFQYKEDPRPFESRCRQWSLSTDSLYLQANKNRKDKRCSSGSVDDFGENDVISFTNVSYCSSNDESQFPKRNRHPLQPSLGEKVWSSEDHEVEKGKGDAKNEKRVQWNHDELDCTNNDGTKSKSSELKKQLPHVTEGLCIFLVGGKYYGNHEFFTKGIDIWRCDVTKRQKRSSKVTKIKVQTAGTDLGTAKGASADRTTCAYNENMKTAGMNSRVSANVSPSPMDGSIRTCLQKPFKTSENQNLAVNDDTTTSKAGIYHGDLVITDLGFSDDLHPAKDN